jgi:hypothetical protein
MSDFLDIGDEDDAAPALPVVAKDAPSDPMERVRAFEKAWAELSDPQKKYLAALKDNSFRQGKAIEAIGKTRTYNSTVYRWRSNEHFAFIEKAMKADVVKDILERERLVIRHDNIVEDLLEPKPILYQGAPTGFYENQAGQAAKVNETLLRVGGHLKEEDQKNAFAHGPGLVIQVIAQDGTVQIAQVNNGIEIKQPTPSFLEIDDV